MKYSVEVSECEAPEKVEAALSQAGPARTTYRPDDQPLVGRLMFAHVEADSAGAAEARVREIVGDDCQIGPTERVELGRE